MTTQIDTIKNNFFNVNMKTITNTFGEQKAKQFGSAMVMALQNNPGLLKYPEDSLFTAFLNCAEFKLMPSTVSGEAYIIPYKGRAKFQLGYQGLITLLYRAGITAIGSDIVKKNDTTEILSGTNPQIIHKIPLGERGEALGVYAWAEVNGQTIYKYMSKKDIMSFKEFSQSKNSTMSPWNEKNDPELNMWKKTAIKQLSKTLPKNMEINQAIAIDNEEGDIKEFIKTQLKENSDKQTARLEDFVNAEIIPNDEKGE